MTGIILLGGVLAYCLTMHELSLAAALLDLLEEQGRRHEFRRVRTVVVTRGTGSCVDPLALERAFGAVTAGTFAEGAALRFESGGETTDLLLKELEVD